MKKQDSSQYGLAILGGKTQKVRVLTKEEADALIKMLGGIAVMAHPPKKFDYFTVGSVSFEVGMVFTTVPAGYLGLMVSDGKCGYYQTYVEEPAEIKEIVTLLGGKSAFEKATRVGSFYGQTAMGSRLRDDSGQWDPGCGNGL